MIHILPTVLGETTSCGLTVPRDIPVHKHFNTAPICHVCEVTWREAAEKSFFAYVKSDNGEFAISNKLTPRVDQAGQA